jgi:hypothetical protein
MTKIYDRVKSPGCWKFESESGGGNDGASGTINLSRVGPTPPGLWLLTQDQRAGIEEEELAA